MIEHIILEARLNPNMKVATDFDSSENSPMLQALLDGFEKGDELIESSKNVVPNGYIILLDEKQKPRTEDQEDVEM
jgi:superfamily I DNA and RNA helicase